MAMSLKIPAIAAAALGFGLFMVAPSEGATLPASLPTLVQPSAAAPITVGYRRWYGGGYGGGNGYGYRPAYNYGYGYGYRYPYYPYAYYPPAYAVVPVPPPPPPIVPYVGYPYVGIGMGY